MADSNPKEIITQVALIENEMHRLANMLDGYPLKKTDVICMADDFADWAESMLREMGG